MIHNELRYAVDIQRAHRIAFGEPGAWGIERLGETLTPTVDLWTRPEWALLRTEVLWGTSTSQVAGAAGTFAKCGVHNPAGSRGICVVMHHVITGVGVAAGISLELEDAILANQGAAIPLDRRLTGTTGVISMAEASAGAASANVVCTVSGIPGGNVIVEWPVILPPGRGLRWRNSDDAAELSVSFRGYLRQGYPGELE